MERRSGRRDKHEQVAEVVEGRERLCVDGGQAARSRRRQVGRRSETAQSKAWTRLERARSRGREEAASLEKRAEHLVALELVAVQVAGSMEEAGRSDSSRGS